MAVKESVTKPAFSFRLQRSLFLVNIQALTINDSGKVCDGVCDGVWFLALGCNLVYF